MHAFLTNERITKWLYKSSLVFLTISILYAIYLTFADN